MVTNVLLGQFPPVQTRCLLWVSRWRCIVANSPRNIFLIKLYPYVQSDPHVAKSQHLTVTDISLFSGGELKNAKTLEWFDFKVCFAMHSCLNQNLTNIVEGPTKDDCVTPYLNN